MKLFTKSACQRGAEGEPKRSLCSPQLLHPHMSSTSLRRLLMLARPHELKVAVQSKHLVSYRCWGGSNPCMQPCIADDDATHVLLLGWKLSTEVTRAKGTPPMNSEWPPKANNLQPAVDNWKDSRGVIICAWANHASATGSNISTTPRLLSTLPQLCPPTTKIWFRMTAASHPRRAVGIGGACIHLCVLVSKYSAELRTQCVQGFSLVWTPPKINTAPLSTAEAKFALPLDIAGNLVQVPIDLGDRLNDSMLLRVLRDSMALSVSLSLLSMGLRC